MTLLLVFNVICLATDGFMLVLVWRSRPDKDRSDALFALFFLNLFGAPFLWTLPIYALVTR